MTKPLLTDAQIHRRQKLQGHLAAAGATLGLTALGSRGASALVGAGKLTRLPVRTATLGQRLDHASTTLTTVGAGLGGIAGFNSARLIKDTTRRRVVKKNAGDAMDFGLSGVQQGSAERFEEVSKAYDPEANRMKRMDHYSTATAAASGATAASALHYAQKGKSVVKLVKNPVWGGPVKNAGKAAGLTAAAAGLAVGSQKIREYKTSKGARYTPLRRDDF